MTSTDVLLVSGGARFGDPWHPFADTSAALTEILKKRGYGVTVSEDADAGLALLASRPR